MPAAAVRPAPPASNPATALVRLRAATQRHHEHIESLMELDALGQTAHYRRVLHAFETFLVPWEAGVAAALGPEWHAWLIGRSRLRMLRSDLDALGFAVPAPPVQVPALDGPAAALGALYVVEGSALGGQVIVRALAGTAHARATAFFHGWGAGTGAMWADFRRRLGLALDADPAGTDRACAAAQATFTALAAHLRNILDECPAAA